MVYITRQAPLCSQPKTVTFWRQRCSKNTHTHLKRTRWLCHCSLTKKRSHINEDILLQVVAAVSSPTYSLQLYKSTDIASFSQLIVYVRYLDREVMKEEYLFSEPVATTTRGQDIFKILEVFLFKHELGWEALVGVCTDGAPSVTGCISGFKVFVENVAPHVSFAHCMSH
ncbi:protein FAM200C-like [Oratosquilla oratoria]|uniref:protein FAM200C-like n=1 Tax=Oratosquilla oratoria TaxID=337810 RepID=UPI003F766B06